jgi:hypothetical protein
MELASSTVGKERVKRPERAGVRSQSELSCTKELKVVWQDSKHQSSSPQGRANVVKGETQTCEETKEA